MGEESVLGFYSSSPSFSYADLHCGRVGFNEATGREKRESVSVAKQSKVHSGGDLNCADQSGGEEEGVVHFTTKSSCS